MRTFIHGTDRGNVMLTVLVLIIVLSSVFLALAAYVRCVKRYTYQYKSGVIRNIEQFNREAENNYDLH